MAAGLVKKHHSGVQGRTAEYSVLDVERLDCPNFEEERTNYGHQWALESGFAVDPTVAELLYGLIEIKITKTRFLEDIEWLTNQEDQRMVVIKSALYWRRRGQEMRGLAKHACDWEPEEFWS